MEDEGEVAAMDHQEQQEVDLEAATVIDDGAEEECDKPPDYNSLQLAQERLPKQSTFVAEAPPTYQQLFGRKSSEQRRPHTRPRSTQTQRQRERRNERSLIQRLQERYPKLNKLLSRLSVVFVILSLVGLCAAMIIVGSVNLTVCANDSVPVYLIVAGALMLAELIFHGALWMLMKYTDNDSTFRALRVCDCVAFVLLVWLLIGSNWVFRVAIAGRITCPSSSRPIDNIVFLNTTTVTDASGHTQFVVLPSIPDSPSTSTYCPDCSAGVYQFTIVVILFQYVAALFICIGCCSKLFKK